MKKLRDCILASLFAAGLAFSAAALNASEDSAHWVPGTTYCLEGYTGFYVYSYGEQITLFDAGLPCTAVLTISGRDSFVMESVEYFPDGSVREATWYGTITPSGRISYPYPDEPLAIQLHIGLTVHGRGVIDGVAIYKGWFDEVTLIANWELVGHQTQPALVPFYNKDPADPTVLFDGPISIYEEFVLEVVDCNDS